MSPVSTVIFEAGDIIEMKCSCSGAIEGQRYILGIRNGNELYTILRNDPTPDNGCSCEYNWILIEKNNKLKKQTMSNIIDKIKLNKMAEPDKSLVKAGIIEMDGSVTNNGRYVLDDFLIKKFGADIKKDYADDIIADQEK